MKDINLKRLIEQTSSLICAYIALAEEYNVDDDEIIDDLKQIFTEDDFKRFGFGDLIQEGE